MIYALDKIAPGTANEDTPVSYTHLDVYKRQDKEERNRGRRKESLVPSV